MLRNIILIGLLVITGLLTGTSAFAQEVQFECEVLDAATEQPKTTFSPGDRIKLRVLIDLPENALAEKVRVEVFVETKVAGIEFLTKITEFTALVPDKATRQEIGGWKEEWEPEVPKKFDLEQSVEFTLPDFNKLPAGAVTLNATGSIEGYSPAVCEKTIEIVRE